MDIEINEVHEIIKNLEGGGELSIKEEKYLKIAKLCVQLAAENVALKTFCKNAAFDADYEAEPGMEGGGLLTLSTISKPPPPIASWPGLRLMGWRSSYPTPCIIFLMKAKQCQLLLTFPWLIHT